MTKPEQMNSAAVGQSDSNALLYDNFDRALRDDFSGYHIEISIYPSGGMISASGCELCGTSENVVLETVLWRFNRGDSLHIAARKLKEKLMAYNGVFSGTPSGVSAGKHSYTLEDE